MPAVYAAQRSGRCREALGLLDAHLPVLGLLLGLAIALGDALLLFPAPSRLLLELVAAGPFLPPLASIAHSASQPIFPFLEA